MKRCRTVEIAPAVVSKLTNLQDKLNRFIDPDWTLKRHADDWGLAVAMEATELMDSYPWKWWKNVKAQPDIGNVKVELVDILHFALSGTMQMSKNPPAVAAPIASIKEEAAKSAAELLVSPLTETANAVQTFRSVIDLARMRKFDTVTEVVIAAADDLGFNLVGYYVAKHTLNYIRQLGGYKDGSYKKVRAGVEDNELLHDCVAQAATPEEAVGEQWEKAWDAVMLTVYDAFQVEQIHRRRVVDWM